MQYKAVIERSRSEIETLLRSSEGTEIADALLSAAYYDPDWKWVQDHCMTFSRHQDKNVRWASAVCFGHLARIHRQLDLEPVLQRLAEMKSDPLVTSAANDAMDDIKFYLRFQ
ncbi:MAG: hypothetical protein JST28_14920 [Acidobacteria bacterium]|nr:hypothetical protein [Acidobacteriota bacterium]